MKKVSYTVSILTIILIFSGCSSKTVQVIDKRHMLSKVCIENNPKVVVSDFIPVVEDIFQSHGIATEVYTGNDVPKNCDVKMTYTATRKWDIVPFLAHAELRVYKEGEKIGYAEYHLIGGGGFDLSKWASVKSKMTPVVEELLIQYKQKS